MRDRVVRGFLDAVQGLEFVTLLSIAVLSAIPGVSLLTIPVAAVYVVTIVKASSEGETKRPAWVETDDILGRRTHRAVPVRPKPE